MTRRQGGGEVAAAAVASERSAVGVLAILADHGQDPEAACIGCTALFFWEAPGLVLPHRASLVARFRFSRPHLNQQEQAPGRK